MQDVSDDVVPVSTGRPRPAWEESDGQYGSAEHDVRRVDRSHAPHTPLSPSSGHTDQIRYGSGQSPRATPGHRSRQGSDREYVAVASPRPRHMSSDTQGMSYLEMPKPMMGPS